MENGNTDSDEDTRRLVVAIIDFLRDQLQVRTDLVPEDRDCLEIAIQCLEMAYGLEAQRYVQYRFSRPLLDVFNQVTNPVSIRDKLRAEAHKDEGNSYMRRDMFSDAEEEYTQAIELDKWNAIYYCNRASSRIEQRNFFDAIADCRQALMLNPDYAKAHARMGQAYALIHRPREAARCFRQALDLEPDNERYRNNLRVAESQITRPDGLGLIAALLSSIFGLPSGNPNDPSESVSMPTSIMIITETHPPTREEPSESVTESVEQRTESDHSEECAEEPKGVVSDSSTEGHPIIYRAPYGVVDEGSEEQPLPQIDIPTDINVTWGDEGEFMIDFPESFVLEDERLPTTFDDEDDAWDERVSETEGGHIQPDLSTGAQVTDSENKSPDQKVREEELNAKIKASRDEVPQFRGVAGTEGIPSSSTEPPRVPESVTDHKPADQNLNFIYGNETPTGPSPPEGSYDRVQPGIDKISADLLKPSVDDIAITVSDEAKDETEQRDGCDRVLHGTDDSGEVKQVETRDSESGAEKCNVVENDPNADSVGQDQQSNENETCNISNSPNIKDKQEKGNESEDPDDDGSLR